MILFPCRCGYSFSLPEEKAGGLVQCPQCGRLNDVPTLGDLAGITEDGTYKMETPVYDEAEIHRLAELQRAFAKEKIDEYGRELDLRPTVEDIQTAGADEIPLDMKDVVRPGAPKYDPITGELIRPLDIKPDQQEASGPIPVASRAMHYAWAGSQEMRTRDIFLALFTGPNLFVMFVILFTHVILQILAIASIIAWLITVPSMFIVAGLLVGHYANTIDETGPEAIDELPRPLRHLQWHEDLFGSFVRIMTAFLFCYGPAVWVLLAGSIPTPARLTIALLWSLIGTVVFPAVVLTTTTSGSIFNLRPDRVISVIRYIGPTYLFTLGFWLLSAAIYCVGMFGTMGTMTMMFETTPPRWAEIAFSPFMTYPILCIGIYLTHAFCWHLGLLYRQHHMSFPWVFQRYTSMRRSSGTAPPPPPPAKGFQVLPPPQQQPKPNEI